MFRMENPMKTRMMTGGTPHLWKLPLLNLHWLRGDTRNSAACWRNCVYTRPLGTAGRMGCGLPFHVWDPKPGCSTVARGVRCWSWKRKMRDVLVETTSDHFERLSKIHALNSNPRSGPGEASFAFIWSVLRTALTSDGSRNGHLHTSILDAPSFQPYVSIKICGSLNHVNVDPAPVTIMREPLILFIGTIATSASCNVISCHLTWHDMSWFDIKYCCFSW